MAAKETSGTNVVMERLEQAVQATLHSALGPINGKEEKRIEEEGADALIYNVRGLMATVMQDMAIMIGGERHTILELEVSLFVLNTPQNNVCCALP